MKFALFIHNDDVKCFHMVVQGTHKLVMMGHVNFKDHALIKRQRANEKMNLTGGMLKDEKKHDNC
jgi:deferrochelatase/peroxidase EfeB